MEPSNTRVHVRKKQIRSVVARIREEHALVTAPIDVEELARQLAARVMKVETDDDELSGFLYRDPQSGEAVIGINKGHSETRKRFTLAHELGHLVLHSFDNLHYDRKGYGSGFGRVRMRDSASSTGENRDEVEANFFAAELLMPEELLYQELRSRGMHDFLESDFDAAVKLLAKQFKVSPQALTVRLVQIGILSPD
jgi:Zn-dependent peptidase ImmA (M78 family)